MKTALRKTNYYTFKYVYIQCIGDTRSCTQTNDIYILANTLLEAQDIGLEYIRNTMNMDLTELTKFELKRVGDIVHRESL